MYMYRDEDTAQKAGHYRVISEQDLARLEQEVNYYLKEGYHPVGGVSLTRDQGETTWAQAMMKRSPYA